MKGMVIYVKYQCKEIKLIEKTYTEKASITVEAAFVLPIFIYAIITLLYFIQIFMVQEQLQAAITEVGRNTAKYTYLYKDYFVGDETEQVTHSFHDMEGFLSVKELINQTMDATVLKHMVKEFLDTKRLDYSCIQDGYDGISFLYSSILDDDCIDIIIQYMVRIPLKFFRLNNIKMIQRVRLRAWTGQQVTTTYGEDKGDKEDDTNIIVYITETGTVYHKTRNCSHLKLTIKSIQGLPHELRNKHGGKYYECELCGKKVENNTITYYITTDGTRYHTIINCSGLKRTVIEVELSEVAGKGPCSRCGGSSSTK